MLYAFCTPAPIHLSRPCQAFYNEVLESFFTATAPKLKSLHTAPASAITLTFIGFDVGLTAAFIAYSLPGVKMFATLATLAAVPKAAHALRLNRAK